MNAALIILCVVGIVGGLRSILKVALEPKQCGEPTVFGPCVRAPGHPVRRGDGHRPAAMGARDA